MAASTDALAPPQIAILRAMIEVENLTKRYGAHTAVDGVSFRCDPGHRDRVPRTERGRQVHDAAHDRGLTPPDAGAATVLDTDYRSLPNPGRARRRAARRVRAARRPHRRARCSPLRADHRRRRARVPELLELVGLEGGRRASASASTRWACASASGIAHALLGDPQVLILDEPANGLDPEGILWMRGLLRDFADRGGTVLLSSHLLREVEAIADGSS